MQNIYLKIMKKIYLDSPVSLEVDICKVFFKSLKRAEYSVRI